MTLNPPNVLLHPDDLERMPGLESYELIDGTPKEKQMGAESDEIALALGGKLRDYVLANKLGRVYGTSTGYKKCFPHAPNLLRKPDVSFVAEARLPNGHSPRGDFSIAPVFATEVVSPNDLYEEVEEKVCDYRQAGVRLIWVINPATKTVLVRRLDRTCAELDDTGTLSGEDVIPGFSCPVAELFV